jgi:AraC family transcriptional regulator of adaptative response/methylated-DNA-[protein]-cysteine methyltransferase
MAIITKTIITPIGKLLCGVFDDKICLLEFADPERLSSQIKKLENMLKTNISEGENELFYQVEQQLSEYFNGKRKEFSLPIVTVGSDFQKKVWAELLKIPYGETRSYSEQSLAVGNIKSIRAVAAANGANRIAILIPCHRVIGKNGALIGFGGGLENKKILLELEQKYINTKNTLF